MGMPVTVEVIGGDEARLLEMVFDFFVKVDEKYSPYKPTSEVSQINAGLPKAKWSQEMRQIVQLCEQTSHETNGYFNAWHNNIFDPSGLVKGWAIKKAAEILTEQKCSNFYVEAGGDIQVKGSNKLGSPWRIGIRNPFNRNQIVKVISLNDGGVATSGTAIRGQHIYNPINPRLLSNAVSITVVAPSIYDADRMATAAFAMGHDGINFIDKLPGYEAYMIKSDATATSTQKFERFVLNAQAAG